MHLFSIFLILLIANGAFSQYLVANLYTSSTCSSNSAGVYAIPTTCTATSNSTYQLASCISNNYVVKNCTDNACSQNCNTVATNTTSCSNFTLYPGSYGTVSCGSLPSLVPYAYVSYYPLNSNPNNSCNGSLLNVLGAKIGVCIPFISNSANYSTVYTCNSHYIIAKLCADTLCSVNCTPVNFPIGCSNSLNAILTCGNTSSAASSTPHTSSISHHTSSTSHHTSSTHHTSSIPHHTSSQISPTSHSHHSNSPSHLYYANSIVYLLCLVFVFFIKPKNE